MGYLEYYDLKEQFNMRQEFAFEIDFTGEYGQHVYNLEELQPGLAKIVIKAALAERKLQNAIHEILDFDKVED